MITMNGVDIRRYRRLLGWSQERLARELNVSFSTVNRWEAGKTRPNGMARKALAALFSKLSPSENRTCRRIPLRFPIRIFSAVGCGKCETGCIGLCEDISIGGFMFKSEESFTAGEKLKISFDCETRPRRLKEGICAASEVVWTATDAGGGTWIKAGARFNGLGKSDFAKIVTAAFFN
ncbi:MAG: helix-turn-helix domain-containing protein [Deltaproteobacteria bacterium]|nr:helix-turn-helix domain-containing protein [Deltaproteobacteria bacterium]